MLSAQDYSAELAERYGWVNRAVPAAALGDFVRTLAQRIASFPAAATLSSRTASMPWRWPRLRISPRPDASATERPEPKRDRAAMRHGFQTRGGEILARMLGDLGSDRRG
jgi:enoyl-CoA hydratase/carnithine racemase